MIEKSGFILTAEKIRNVILPFRAREAERAHERHLKA